MLVKVEPRQAQTVAVETAARRLEVTVQPATVEPGETLVLYLDLLTTEDEAPVAAGIRRWLEAGGRNAPRRILVHGAGEWLEADTTLSAAVLEKDLRARIRSNLETGAAPAGPAALFDQLLAVLPEAGDAWRTVIWAGRFPALPALKIAANDLISQLRQGDSVGVFGFRDRLETIQDFTADHKAAMLAVRRIRTEGRTALFDATARVSALTARQKGRKALVVFTDGEDNASTLTRQRAMEAAKRHGIPCYLIAQGEALKSRRLVETLEQMAADTGGDSFRVSKVNDIAEVFSAISRDLRNTYLLAFRARAEDRKWYPLAVSIRDRKDLKVRCRKGYYLD